MITIYIIDNSPESRNNLFQKFLTLLDANPVQLDLLPRITFKPISPSELKYQSMPDIAILGPGLTIDSDNDVKGIRKTLPNTPLIAIVEDSDEHLLTIERLARYGIDDTISPNPSSSILLRRIILLMRKISRTPGGKLVLIDSGKGGIGATSFSAALAEGIVDHNRRCLLLDLDFSNQSLSRFLQSKPFINENLSQLLEGTRPITQEFVEQSVYQIWEDADLYCMPPIPENDGIYTHHSGYAQNLVSVLEIADSLFDIVIVDLAGLKGPLRTLLYRLADRVVLLTNSDPATFFPTISRLNLIQQHLASESKVLILENSLPGDPGLDSDLFKKELFHTTGLEKESWGLRRIPFCKQALRWPASGGTMYSVGKVSIKQSLQSCIDQLDLEIKSQVAKSALSPPPTLLSRLRKPNYLFHRRNQTPSTIDTSKKRLLPEFLAPIAVNESVQIATRNSDITQSEEQARRMDTPSESLVSDVFLTTVNGENNES